MERSDSELVEGSLAGDPTAFEEIVRRFQRLVFNIVYHYLGRREVVEDVSQEIFLKLYRSLDRFDTTRPLKAWVGRIASNACLDELRRGKARREQSFADFGHDEQDRLESLIEKTASGTSLSEDESEKIFALLQKALSELSEKDRMAFVLRDMEELEYSEVAQALAASETAARIRVSRARKKLQARVRSLMERRGLVT